MNDNDIWKEVDMTLQAMEIKLVTNPPGWMPKEKFDYWVKKVGIGGYPLLIERFLFGIKNKNQRIEIANYFSTMKRPMLIDEFFEFWESLPLREKLYYYFAPLGENE